MKTPSHQNSIRLIHFQVTQLKLNTNGTMDKTITKELKFNLKYQILFSNDDKTQFIVQFTSQLSNVSRGFNLNCVYSAKFQTTKKIDLAFQKSDLVNINAPAIAFPYFRAFITSLSLQGGYEPIIPPTLNFVDFKNSKK